MCIRDSRAAGATEVHMRIASPPTTNPCFYGVDTPDKSQLIAAQKTIDEIADSAGTIGYEFLTSLGHRYNRKYTGVTK